MSCDHTDVDCMEGPCPLAEALQKQSSKLEERERAYSDLSQLCSLQLVEIKTLKGRLDAAEKSNERLRNLAAGMFWSGGNFDDKTMAEVIALGLDARSRLHSCELLASEAEGLLCDPRGGKVANELSARIRAFLVETRSTEMWKLYRVGDYWQCATPVGPYNFQAFNEEDAQRVVDAQRQR